ncbi:MAG: Hpt domain-containing protein [Lachnospiraceae bacterium]|nr:Hpt domain-containing protein [Lachnospiraceae bacterium]
MTVQECYTISGGDYEAAIGVFRREERICRFLRMFPEDPSFGELEEAMASEDAERAFHAVHTLKGVAANLYLTALHRAASDVTELLRAGDLGSAKVRMPDLREVYLRTRECTLQV